jgi:signal transduction histidine kinase
VAVGAVVLALVGLFAEAREREYFPSSASVAVAGLLVAGAMTARRAQGTALALLWSAFVVHLGWSAGLVPVDVVVVWIGFATARWGSNRTVWISGASIPLAAVLAGAWVLANPYLVRDLLDFRVVDRLVDAFGTSALIGPAAAGFAILAIPWLAGLTARDVAGARSARQAEEAASADASAARAAAERERELAVIRAGQAQLARDVHDVVGHSLTVILAQAESAQVLDDPVAIKAALANVATAARGSLGDVRRVLEPTGSRSPAPTQASLDGLVESVRSAGHEVKVIVEGDPRPLSPDRASVVYRVMQEMLTNALRHGERGAAITVTWDWSAADKMRMAVTNTIASAHTEQGLGIVGMRRRLEAVGGELVTGVDPADASRFVATALLPTHAPGAVLL